MSEGKSQVYVVVGGGVAGVCAVEELQRHAPQGSSIVLVSVSPSLKGVGNVVRLTENLEEFEVVERDLASIAAHPSTRVVVAAVVKCDCIKQELLLSTGEHQRYDKLLCATGAVPKVLSDHPCVVTLRDTDSVLSLKDRLTHARRVLVVGNGGIALELVGALRGVLDVVWVLKHGHVGDAFFDTDAASFLLKHLEESGHADKGGVQHELQPRAPPQQPQPQSQPPEQQQPASHLPGREGLHGGAAPPPLLGHAAGPKWTQHLQLGRRPHPECAVRPGGAADGCEGREGPAAGLILELSALVECVSSSPPASQCADEDGGLQGIPQAHGQAQPQQHPAAAAAAASGCRADGPGVSPQGVGGASPPACGGWDGVVGGEAGWPVYASLTNGKVIGADLIVSAIGVTPATHWLPPELARAPDGGLLVDGRLCCLPAASPQATSKAEKNASMAVGTVFAAGDCCTIPEEHMGPHFFQMRLWTQARFMGIYAGHCMAGVEGNFGSSFGLELFTHATRFFGLKVVLLGLYNGQRLEHEPAGDIQMYVRQLDASHEGSGAGPSFVRVLLLRGRMQGCVLIGETDYEEVFEHLILDCLDLSQYGPELLDPEVELEDFFD